MTPRPKTRKMTRIAPNESEIEEAAIEIADVLRLVDAPRGEVGTNEAMAYRMAEFAKFKALSKRSKARRELVKEITDHTKSCEWSARQGGNTIRAERWAATTRMILAFSNPGRGKR